MATSDKIEVGDIVKLTSNATKFMTVHSIDGKFIECFWVNQSGAVVYRIFEGNALELVSKKV